MIEITKKDVMGFAACLETLDGIESEKAQRLYLMEEFQSRPRIIRLFRCAFDRSKHFEIEPDDRRALPKELRIKLNKLAKHTLELPVRVKVVNKALRLLDKKEIEDKQTPAPVSDQQIKGWVLAIFNRSADYVFAKLRVDDYPVADVTMYRDQALDAIEAFRKMGVHVVSLKHTTIKKDKRK